MSPEHADAQRFWDAHYTRHPDVWSGAPNAVLVDEIGDLHPAAALDLGCGEGADAIWLAQQGWKVTAVDVSAVALARAAAHAADAGVGDRITWERHDLNATFPSGSFEFVSAHYLHSSQQTSDRLVHQRAVRAVAPGGTLLLVGHASEAPWSWDQHARLPTAGDIYDGLHLPTGRWAVDVCEDRPRQATGPNGETATVIDSVVRVRRRTPSSTAVGAAAMSGKPSRRRTRRRADTPPPTHSATDEKSVLVSFLDYLRTSIASKVEDTPEPAVRTPGVPSGTNLLGLINHLTHVERFTFLGEQVANWAATFRAADDQTVTDVLADYRRSIEQADARITACGDLDQPAREPTTKTKPPTMRWALVHMIEETGRHAGHADILRELIDGTTGR